MTATFISGAQVAEEIKTEVASEVAGLGELGVQPGLCVVLVGTDPASSSYVNMKARTCEQIGIFSQKITLPADTETSALLARIDALNADSRIDGILVQIPLPRHIDKHSVLERIAPAKDVDGFHSSNLGSLVLGHERLVACTPLGVMELLRRSGTLTEGATAVVLGRSDDVGKPLALLLMHANATVTICHSRTKDLASVTRQADIVVAAIGRTALVTADYIKPGATVVDVGTNKVSGIDEIRRLFGDDPVRLRDFEKRGYVWAGDVDERSVRNVAGKLTPVPGGVGPMTIAMLMKNTVRAARLRRGI